MSHYEIAVIGMWLVKWHLCTDSHT